MFFKLYSEDNKIPRTLSEAGKMAGPATYKQSKTIGNCFQFIQLEDFFLLSVCRNKLLAQSAWSDEDRLFPQINVLYYNAVIYSK